MSEEHAFLAFLATLVTIVVIAIIAAVLAYNGKYAEALGFGGMSSGLLAVLGKFNPRAAKDQS